MSPHTTEAGATTALPPGGGRSQTAATVDLSVRRRAGVARPITVAADEAARIWHRQWVCVGVADQIPEPGDLLPATVGDAGLHVQREIDGTLRAGFNALQHGSCWTVPVQCRAGHKVKCPYVSCAFSIDTDALAADAGAPTREMRQFTGASPGRLLAVPARQAGPLIFVSLGRPQPPPFAEQVLPRLAGLPVALDGLRYLTRVTVALDCSWSQAAQSVASAAGLVADSAGDVRVGSAPPNLVAAGLADHLALAVIKPIGSSRCTVMTALYAMPGSPLPTDDDSLRDLAGRWRAGLVAQT